MNNITDIEDCKPHFTIPTIDDGIHVLPVSLLRDVSTGIADIDTDLHSVIRTIIGEWLDNYE